MPARLVGMSSVGARALAVVLAVLSLTAPRFAGWGLCREPECAEQSACGLSPADFSVPEAAPCPCPASCESGPPGGCGQASDRGLDSLSGIQPQRIRRGAVERLSLADATAVGTEVVPGARTSWPSFGGLSFSSASAPLFIRNRSIIR